MKAREVPTFFYEGRKRSGLEIVNEEGWEQSRPFGVVADETGLAIPTPTLKSGCREFFLSLLRFWENRTMPSGQKSAARQRKVGLRLNDKQCRSDLRSGIFKGILWQVFPITRQGLQRVLLPWTIGANRHQFPAWF